MTVRRELVTAKSPSVSGPTVVPAARLISTGGSSEARRALALFLLFAGFYLLTASGHFYAVDEEILYDMTASLVERHSLALPPGMWYIAPSRAAQGPVYAEYMPGQPLVAVPLYLLGRAVAPLFPADAHGYVTRFFVSLLGPLVTAATVTLLYLLARVLGYRVWPALALAASYGLATMAWPHGRTFFAEPLTTCLLLLAFYCLCRGTREQRRPLAGVWLATAGVAFMAAVVVKPHAMLVLPVYTLYLLGRLVGRYTGGGWRRTLYEVVVAFGAWGMGLVLPGMLVAVFTLTQYGGITRTGYGPRPLNLLSPTQFPIFAPTELLGLTLLPGKGVLWYAPPLLLALAAGWRFWRRCRAEALACLAIVVLHLWFYSRFPWWHGDGSWGPRFLATMLPFATLPLVALLDPLPRWWAWRTALVAVVTLGVAVQLLGVLVNFDWYLLRSDETARHFTPAASPLVAHARILATRVTEWYGRLRPPRDTVVLTGGFRYAGDRIVAPPLPRWTTGTGEIALYAAAHEPLLVRLRFDDPCPAPGRWPLDVAVNGHPLARDALTWSVATGAAARSALEWTIPAAALTRNAAIVTLRAPTCGTTPAGQGAEADVDVRSIEVRRTGQQAPWPVREALALAIEPLPRTPRQQFWWFNDDNVRHHLIDHWAWYAAVAGFPRGLATRWLAAYAGGCLTLIIAGLLLWPRRSRPRPDGDPGTPRRDLAVPRA